MLRNAFLKTLRDARRAIAWWSLGLVAMTALMVAVYPSVRDNPDLNKMVDDYPDAFKAFFGLGENVDYTSAVGYLNSELFSFMVPLLLLDRRDRRRCPRHRRRGGTRHARSPARQPDLAPPARARQARRARGRARPPCARALAGARRRRRGDRNGRLGRTPRRRDRRRRAARLRLRRDRAPARRGNRSRAVATGIAAAGAVAAYLLSSLAELVEPCSRCASPRPSTTTPPATSCARDWPPAHRIPAPARSRRCFAAVIAFERRDLSTPDPDRKTRHDNRIRTADSSPCTVTASSSSSTSRARPPASARVCASRPRGSQSRH